MIPLPRQQALLDKQRCDAALRAFHVQVCELLDTDRGPDLRREARERVALWRSRQLCSGYYVRQWVKILAAPSTVEFRLRVLDSRARNALALMQNTPFSFLMGELSG